MSACAICSKPSRGFLYGHPQTQETQAQFLSRCQSFCSYHCQSLYYQQFIQGELNMNHFEQIEQKAREATLKPLAQLVKIIDVDKPIAHYSKDEALALVDTVIDHYQDFLQSDSNYAQGARSC